MPTFNIYVVNGLDSFQYALNAVAMLFNGLRIGEGLLGETALLGASLAIALGAIGYALKLLNSSILKSYTWTEHALVMVMVIGFSLIPTRVVVQDLYGSRATTAVDNVPLIFSFPASIFSSLSYEIFDVLDTSVQDVSGSYMKVSEHGFATPLKLLFAMRDGLEKTASGFHASLQSYLRDCSINSAIDSKGWSSSVDLMNYLLENGRDNGITYTFLNATGTDDLSYPMPTSCLQSKDRLRLAHNAMMLDNNASPINKLIQLNMVEANESGTGATFNISDVTRAHQILGTAGQNAQQFMMTALIRNAVNNTYNCMSDRFNESSFASCVQVQNDALEAWKVSATAGGSLFQKTVFNAMSLMQVLFFLFGPIVFFYALVLAAGSIRLISGYFLFGMWVFSWMPFVAVINGYIQWTVVRQLEGLAFSGLNHYNFTTVMYDVFSTNLALASDMLAVVPLITLAILAGSPFALAGIANRMSAQQHVDPLSAAPPTLQNAAPVRTNSALAGDLYTGQRSSDLVDYKYDLSQGATDRISSANVASQTSMLNAVRSYGDTVGSLKTELSGYTGQNATAVSSMMGFKDLVNDSLGVGKNFGVEKGYSNDDVIAAQYALEGALGANLAGSGAGIKLSESDIESIRSNLSANSRDVFDYMTQHIYSSSKDQVTSINDVMTVSGGLVGADTLQKVDSFREDLSSAELAQKTYQEVYDRNISFTQGASLNQFQMGSMLGSGTKEAQQALGIIDGQWRALHEKDALHADTLYQTNANMLSANGKSVIPELDAQAKMLAIERVNPGFTSTVSSILIGGAAPSNLSDQHVGIGAGVEGIRPTNAGLGAGVHGSNTSGLPNYVGLRSDAAQSIALSKAVSQAGRENYDDHKASVQDYMDLEAEPFVGRPIYDEDGNKIPAHEQLFHQDEAVKAAERKIHNAYTDKHDLNSDDLTLVQEQQRDRLNRVVEPPSQKGGASGDW